MRDGRRAILAIAAAVSAFWTGAALAQPRAGAHLAAIQAQLVYRDGRGLSEDLVSRQPAFVGWNRIIGEGDAGQPADDLRVSAVITYHMGRSGRSSAPLTIVARAGRMVVAQRTFTDIAIPPAALRCDRSS